MEQLTDSGLVAGVERLLGKRVEYAHQLLGLRLVIDIGKAVHRPSS
jgi:hypothetical protein